MLKEEDFLQWKAHPVTQAVKSHIQENIDNAINAMLNKDPALSEMTIEQYGLFMANMRYFIDGMSQSVDFDALQSDLVEEDEDERG